MLFYSFYKIYSFIKLTKAFKPGSLLKRLKITINVAFLQSKILRRPVIGVIHAFVFWGFCVILFGSLEMLIDGISGTEKSLLALGIVYKVFMVSGDVFAYIIFVAILIFLARRTILKVKRFQGIEMKHKSHLDANVALTMILLLMISLIGMNYYFSLNSIAESKTLYPISSIIAQKIPIADFNSIKNGYETNWWMHITLIFLFMNILPYSKHFHVFMSVPNVFYSRVNPLGKLPNMDNITKEVKSMMNPETAFATTSEPPTEIERFGVKDCEDVTWKNYLDSLSCTQCGRCTSVCPANITGKKLSPRKIMIDLRARMKEKAPHLIKDGKTFNDNKSLIHDYISVEEIWACTTCNACAQECPVNINHPEMIVFMRRYLVMEESAAPAMLNTMFTNIENNGAPWQFSSEDRLLWAKDLETKN